MDEPRVECEHCGAVSHANEVPKEPKDGEIIWWYPKCPDAEFEFNDPMVVNDCLLGSWELKTDS